MNIFGIEGSGKNIDWVESAKSQDNYRVVKHTGRSIVNKRQHVTC